MTSCWFTSPFQFYSTNWVVVGLLNNLAQLLYYEPSLMVECWFSFPLCYKYLIVSMNKSRRSFFYCQSSTLTSSLSLNTCCTNYWLQVVITTITLIGTLLVLGGLNVVMALKLIGLVLNMFCTSIFLGHSPYLCSTLLE
jgi:hypothetical protein